MFLCKIYNISDFANLALKSFSVLKCNRTMSNNITFDIDKQFSNFFMHNKYLYKNINNLVNKNLKSANNLLQKILPKIISCLYVYI